MMRCSLTKCDGDYEQRRIVHTLRHQGRIVVIDGVPAEVCSVCGDVLIGPETVRQIERLLAGGTAPVGSAPLYDYA